MAIVHANRDTFAAEVLQSSQPVLVDFWAVWCGPCQMMGPILEDLEAGAADFKVVKVDVDENPELAAAYQVSSIPTLIVFRDGKPAARAVGVTDKAKLLAMLA